MRLRGEGCFIRHFMAVLPFLAILFLVSPADAQITNPVPGYSINKLLVDYLRPRVYALNQGDGTTPGSLLVLNAVNGQPVQELTLNTNPTDMAMSPAQDALFIINTGSRTISKVDLGIVQVVSEKSIQTPNYYDQNGPLHIAIGRSNLVYFTDGAWNPNIIVFDFDNGTNLATFADTDLAGNVLSGAGGIQLTHDGRFLYRWAQLGWDAGYAGSWVNRFETSTNGALVKLEASTNTLWRSPFDTPVLLDAAERWVFAKQAMLIATNVAASVSQFTNNIYAISLDGSVAFSPTEVLQTQTGNVITNLPFPSTVQTLSGDQSRLFRYDAAGTNIVIYNMSGIAQLSTNVIVPTPADGAIVSEHMTNLNWTYSPFAIAYDSYFGTNQAEVSSAGVTSGECMGRSQALAVGLPTSLVPGASYYWRVDVVTPYSTNKGVVWSFVVSPIAITPDVVSATSIRGVNADSQSLTITSSLPDVAWTASVNGANWLTLNTNAGGTPGVLTLNFETASLPVGTYTNTVRISVGEIQLPVPVFFTNYPLNIVKMITDPARSYIYVLQASPALGENGRLLFFNTTNSQIAKALMLGPSPSDLAIHPIDGRLYIASWGETNTYVVDLDSQSMLPPLHLGTDVYRINPGKTNRVIVEGYDQWVDISIADTTNSEFKARYFLVREGDGETAPNAQAYYHCENNISGAVLRKYGYTNDAITKITESPSHPDGTRNLVMSPDGSTLFWNSYVYNSNLVELGSLGAEIYSCSSDGSLAFSSNQAFDTALRKSFYALPTTTTKSTVENQRSRFWYFDGTTGWIESIGFTNMLSLTVTQQPASMVANFGTNVTFTCKATGFRPAFSWYKDGLALSDGNGFFGSTSNTLAVSNVWGGLSGSYFVVISNSFGAATSAVTSLFVRDPLITTQVVDRAVYVGQDVSFNVSAVGTGLIHYQWRKGGLDLPGGTNALLTLTNVQLSSAGNYEVVLSNNFSSVTSRLAGLYISQYPSVADSFNPGANGSVTAIAIQPDGRIIIGGAFTLVAGQSRGRIARLNSDGTLDAAFDPGANGSVNCILVMEDSKILVGGSFSILGGSGRTNIGRLNADGTVDATFVARAGAAVNTMASQTDGKVLVGGAFPTLNGQSVGRLGRLNQDGTLDTNFLAGVNNTVNALTIQPDGKILIGGIFSVIGQVNRSRIARLNPDASVDGSFDPVASGMVNSILIQPDGYILVGGLFTKLGSASPSYLARLNPDGSVDIGYSPNANGPVVSLALQTDGKHLIAGHFTTLGGQGPGGIARVIPTGSRDTTFGSGANSPVSALQLQTDGKVVVGGAFNTLGVQSRSRIGRLTSTDDVTTSLSYDGTNVVWSREGPMPEVWRTEVEQAVTGTSWAGVGDGVRTASGWVFPAIGINLGTIRVRGFSSSGAGSSSGLFEAGLGAPVFASEFRSLTNLAGSSLTVSLHVLGSEPFGYGWLKNGSPLIDGTNMQGTTTSALTMSNLLGGDSATYSLRVTNGYGAITNGIFQLHVIDPYITNQPASINAGGGSNVTFNVGVAGADPLVYRWFRNGALLVDGNNLAGSTSSSLSVSNVLLQDAATFAVIATNGFGAVTSQVASLTVILPPVSLVLEPSNGSPSTQFSFSASGQFGQSFAIEASTNLVNWTAITSSSFGVGPFYYTNSFTTNTPMIFYRLRMP
jgi:uncharacterized delta-60 repeat protein